MSRLPLRVRVAAAFALAMALVLIATGFYIYARVGDDLATALDQDLRVRAQDLGALVGQPGGSLTRDSGGRLVERGESFGQLIAADGRAIDWTRTVGSRSLLGPVELPAAQRAPMFLDRPSVPGLDEPARLLATPVEHHGRRAVLVVGATRENRAEALRSLRTKLLVAGPFALLVATALGYVLAGSGLRTVEAMRRRAADISAARPGERLPVPRTGDELERLGVTLNDMLARLEEALERQRGFVAEAGHELRTPLALLRAELEFALHHADSEEELRAALREAAAETDRLVQLAGGLLLIASSDDGKLALRLERMRADELLDSVRNRFAWRADDAGRALEAHVADGLALRGDRLRLEQALGNLVDNALRHGAGRVRLEAVAENGSVELHVRDDGSGFPPDFLPRAFGRFSRAEPGGSSGAGLGLSIVDAISRAHGGGARAANRRGHGADVWIEVPSS